MNQEGLEFCTDILTEAGYVGQDGINFSLKIPAKRKYWHQQKIEHIISSMTISGYIAVECKDSTTWHQVIDMGKLSCNHTS